MQLSEERISRGLLLGDDPVFSIAATELPAFAIDLHLLLRRDLDTTVGFTESGVSILELSRPRTADSLGLRLW